MRELAVTLPQDRPLSVRKLKLVVTMDELSLVLSI